MRLINSLLFLEMKSFLVDPRIPKMAACDVKAANIKLLLKASPVSYFILGVELFHKKAFYIFSSSFTTYFGTAVMNDWKTIFDIAIVLKFSLLV